ncbi:hypothetical protein [Aureimonas jatrophae]|uniref:Uncharacterized protein n=1 Tax=Aureimonas jatrophae TaxID=1166073 RepID=A0A1H0MJP4_9HYPH|nr:hypothetical protein [Aureimonas jatrophae]MBB3952925.1 hypothetical protein [Aureimonas jatrophae]SDO80597.1 hypothetical protein SAMN05192530_11431 [Aureimonas jatrophae]
MTFDPPSSPCRLAWHLAALLAMAGGALVATGAVAETVTIGSMSFEIPDASSGWKSQTLKDGFILQKDFPKTEENRRKGAAMIQVIGPFANLPGSFDKGFDTVVGLIQGMAAEDITTKSNGTTINGHRIRQEYRCCGRLNELSAGQRVVGVASQGKQAYFALLDIQLRGDAQDSAEADFGALVRSLKLEGSDRAFELVPREGDGGLDGVYTHLDTGVRPNAFGGIDFYSDSELAVFDPSGLYATELPADGDLAEHCRREPRTCGLYALKGGGFLSRQNEIEMRAVDDDFGTLAAETKPLQQAGGDLMIGEASYTPVPPLPEGTSFEGQWRFFFASSGMTASSSGGVSSERILQLGRDGSFRRTGSTGAMSSQEVGGSRVGFASSGERPVESGRYRVKDYTLELVGDDGSTERLSIFAPEKDSDDLLVIDGSNYLKQK